MFRMSKRNLETCEFETRKKLKGAQKFYYEEGVQGDSKNSRKIKKSEKRFGFLKVEFPLWIFRPFPNYAGGFRKPPVSKFRLT